MNKYRKKPVVIEAFQVPPTDDLRGWAALTGWLSSQGCDYSVASSNGARNVGGIDIKTLEGTMRANISDWIIKGVQGEFYPCKPDIFTETYEPVID